MTALYTDATSAADQISPLHLAHSPVDPSLHSDAWRPGSGWTSLTLPLIVVAAAVAGHMRVAAGRCRGGAERPQLREDRPHVAQAMHKSCLGPMGRSQDTALESGLEVGDCICGAAGGDVVSGGVLGRLHRARFEELELSADPCGDVAVEIHGMLTRHGRGSLR